MLNISPELLRTWESRYKLVAPERGSNNYRQYTDRDVRILLRAKQLVDQGVAIGEVAMIGKQRLLAEAPELPVDEPPAGRPPPLRMPHGECAGVLTVAAQALESEGALQAITDAIVDTAHSCFSRIWVTESPRWLRLTASAGLSRRTIESPRARIDLQSYPYMVGWVARTQHRMLKTGLEHDPRFDPVWITSENIVAAAVIPLERDRRLVGVMASFFRQSITPAVERRLDTFAAMATAAIMVGHDAHEPS